MANSTSLWICCLPACLVMMSKLSHSLQSSSHSSSSTVVLVLLLCCFLSSASSSSSSAAAANSEARALVKWVASGGDWNKSRSRDFVFSNWDPKDQTPCNWTYITCGTESESSGAVTEIVIQSVELAVEISNTLPMDLPFLKKLTISNANLTGEIPNTVMTLRYLQVLDLSSNSLSGEIPSGLFEISSLLFVDLSSNQLSGELPMTGGVSSAIGIKELHVYDNRISGGIPSSIGKLASLEILRIGGNRDLRGGLPGELSECGNLTVLGVADTGISGPIPRSFGKLKKLETLSIYTTMVSGEIPVEIGNCTNLVNVYLYENGISGTLPKEIGKLQKLEKLLLWQNEITGEIPEEIGNCTNLQMIDFSLNSISGGIPYSFQKLRNLQELMLSNNNVSGSIPIFLSKLSQLTQLQIDNNQISGLIPSEIGALKNLQLFFAWQNQLEGSIPPSLASCSQLQALDLSKNHLTGSIPSEIFLLMNLTKLLLLGNNISGSIPTEIGKSKSLVRLRLSSNKIGGVIPHEIGQLDSLSFLDLADNELVGKLPETIGNCSRLQMLDVSRNSLSGSLTNSLSSITGLQILDASWNQFTGLIPGSFGKLVSLSKLILSGNRLSGSIPVELPECYSLQLLDLSSNSLTGVIPLEICRMEGLEIALNLSRNDLEGPIPANISSLEKLSVLDLSYNRLDGTLAPLRYMGNLVTLNVSNNNLTGLLPDTKLFRQISISNLEGNQELCTRRHRRDGDICFEKDGKRDGHNPTRKLHKMKIVIVLLITLTVAMLLGLVGIIRAKTIASRKTGNNDVDTDGDMSWPWQFTPFQKLNFSVDQMVRSLVDANVIGKGCSGTVYRVEMDNGETIAVKKLWHTTTTVCKNGSGRDSFSAEVRTLGSIRHKNIVRFLGCCRNKSTRLLMYDYMENGSLGSLLHERHGFTLPWDLRFQIIIGAAQGVAYLHYDCVPPIVHRDIKANNILIGLNFEPYIADFGLAKLVENAGGDFALSSHTVAGSYGYIAPEYGYMSKITEKSDVYSYGVVVLEVLTGKQPIDPTIPDGAPLVDWVRRRKGSSDVLEPSLRCRPESEINEILQVLGVALLCVSPIPEERPGMKDVAAMLKEIRHEREDCGTTKSGDVLKGCSPIMMSDLPVSAATSSNSIVAPSQPRFPHVQSFKE